MHDLTGFLIFVGLTQYGCFCQGFILPKPLIFDPKGTTKLSIHPCERFVTPAFAHRFLQSPFRTDDIIPSHKSHDGEHYF
jgi:hypothetical protein